MTSVNSLTEITASEAFGDVCNLESFVELFLRLGSLENIKYREKLTLLPAAGT